MPAATVVAVRDLGRLVSDDMWALASRVGADVSLFLRGGTQLMSGMGDQLSPLKRLSDFAVAIVVPPFTLSTADVYGRWDVLEGPVGEVVPDPALPPALRDGVPVRNDLLPAALFLEPRLGDFMADLRSAWGGAVCLTGSGSACFGFFATRDEADDAVDHVAPIIATGQGASLRDVGVSEVT